MRMDKQSKASKTEKGAHCSMLMNPVTLSYFSQIISK